MRAVLERDLLAWVRLRRAFVARVAVALIVAGTILLVLLEEGRHWDDRPDDVAHWLFVGGSVAVLSLLTLLTPPVVAGSILEEREKETLPLVLATPVGPTGFAAAKLTARSLVVLGWGLAALYPIAMVALVGGAGLRPVLDLLALAGAVVLEMGAWGLFISSRGRKLATGVVLAYLAPLLRWTLTIILSFLLLAERGPFELEAAPPIPPREAWGLAATTPIPGLARLVDAGDYDRLTSFILTGRRRFRRTAGPPVVTAPPPPWHPINQPAATALVAALLSAALAVALAGRRLAVEHEPKAPFRLRLRRTSPSRAPPGEGNPVLWKEARLIDSAASRPLFWIVLSLLAVAEVVWLSSLSFTRGLRSSELVEISLVFTCCQAALVGLVAVVNAAATMAHERALGTFDLLRMSRLSMREVLHGKAAGVLVGLGFLGLLPVAHLVICWLGGIFSLPMTLAGLVLLAAQLALWVLVGMVAGAAALRLARGVTRALFAWGTVHLGFPVALAVITIIANEDDFLEATISMCPPIGAGLVLDAVARKTVSYSSWYSTRLYDEHEFAILWMVLLVVGLVVFTRPVLRHIERHLAAEQDGA